MQEPSNTTITAGTRTIERIWSDFEYTGTLGEETRRQRIDEEKTHAAEVLAIVTKRGVIPREYLKQGDDLIDQYGASLCQVIEAGIEDAGRQDKLIIAGADKELCRRIIEGENLKTKILNAPTGSAYVEWSPTDNSWTSEERLAQGYAGDTLVRITARVSEDRFLQFNIIFGESDLGLINACRRAIDPLAKDLESAEEILSDPQLVAIDPSNPSQIVGIIESQYRRGLLKAYPGKAVMDMLRSACRRKKDAWQYVSSPYQEDIFNALIDQFTEAAKKGKDDWESAAAIARGGAWQLLIERYLGKTSQHETNTSKNSINQAATRAAAAGEVFTACGGSLDMKSVMNISVNQITRLEQARVLLSTEVGHGCCQSCGMVSTLYGCGIYCQTCNQAWCEEYALSGRMLETSELLLRKYLKFARG